MADDQGDEETAGDQDQSQETADDQGGSQQTAGDQDQSQETADDQDGSQQTAGDQDQSQETTDDQGGSQQTAGDQDQSQETTDDQGGSQQTAGDQDQSPETTDDQGGSQQTAGDQDQSPETTDDQSKAQQATGNKGKSQTTPSAAGAPKQSSTAQATGATQAQSTGPAGSGVKPPAGFEILEGIDVSYAQGKIDWNAVKGSGVAFAYAKATDGKDPDKTFKTNWAGAGAAGILRGAYHYFYPVAMASDHLQKQVDVFLAQMGSLANNDLPPMVDVEQSLPLKDKSGTVIFPALPPKDIASALTYWLTQVAQSCGRQPIIYTYPAYWKSMLGDSTSFHAFHLWIAQYGNPSSPGSSERPPLRRAPTIPGGWPTFSIWQYAVLTGLPGIGTYVDRDQIIVPTGTSIGDFLNGSPPNPSQK